MKVWILCKAYGSFKANKNDLLVVFVVCLPGLWTMYLKCEDGLCLPRWKRQEFGLLHLQTRDSKWELKGTIGDPQWSGGQVASLLPVPTGYLWCLPYAYLYSMKTQICVMWLYRKHAFQCPWFGRCFGGVIPLPQFLILIAEIFGPNGACRPNTGDQANKQIGEVI